MPEPNSRIDRFIDSIVPFDSCDCIYTSSRIRFAKASKASIKTAIIGDDEDACHLDLGLIPHPVRPPATMSAQQVGPTTHREVSDVSESPLTPQSTSSSSITLQQDGIDASASPHASKAPRSTPSSAKPAESYTLRKTIYRPYVTPFERILHHKYPGSGTNEDPYIVDWIGDDPEDPQRWPTVYKWTTIVIVSIATLAVALSSSAYSGGIQNLEESFGASQELLIAGVVSAMGRLGSRFPEFTDPPHSLFS